METTILVQSDALIQWIKVGQKKLACFIPVVMSVALFLVRDESQFFQVPCSMPLSQSELTSILVSIFIDGSIYACGGYNGRTRMSTVEKYDPERNQWELVQSMNRQRSDASACSLNGKVRSKRI